MSFDEREEDPEVVRDRQLRAASERDSTRTRGVGVYSWQPPAMVGMWRCRREGCKTMVPVDADALEYRAMFNAELKRRGEEPLDQNEIVWCGSCRAAFEKARAHRLWERKGLMAETVRRLRDSSNPRKASDLLADLLKLKHPDVPGLLDAIEARQKGKTEQGKRSRAKGAGL